MFDIKTPKRMYFLAVDTKEEMTTWVRMICSACGLQSTKDEVDSSYPPPPPTQPSLTTTSQPPPSEDSKPVTSSSTQQNNLMTSSTAAAALSETASATQPSISSPYIHISTCYSGKPPPPKPEQTAAA